MHIADSEVLSPASPRPHVLVAFNAPSPAKVGPGVRPDGSVVYDRSVIALALDNEPNRPARYRLSSA